jgi:hypothetical protein
LGLIGVGAAGVLLRRRQVAKAEPA